MNIIVYILRCTIMLLVTWTGVRLMGEKSLSEMTAHDLAVLMLLTTVAAEPLVVRVTSKATVGVFTLVMLTIILGYLSLRKLFYNIDSKPIIIIAEGKIIEKELKKIHMNIPLLMSELRIKGYQNVSEVKYAILEPSGKMSIIPNSQVSPVTPLEMGIPTAPVNLSFALVIDGEVDEKNLAFLQKDRKWLLDQLQAFEVGRIEDVLLAQYDSSGQLFVNVKNKEVEIPNIL